MHIISKFFQHNWLAILYFNFRMLPFKQAIKLPFDIYHGIRFDNLSGTVMIKAPIHRAMIKFGMQGSDMFQHKGCIISIEGNVVFHGSCVFGCNNLLKVRKCGSAEFGDNCIFGANNLIYVEERISFGRDFLSSWDCQFMDSDTHTLINGKTGKILKSTKPITIGMHCWIGKHVNINKGVVLPDETIVASNSLVNKDFSTNPKYCMVAGSPAKVVKQDIIWKI